MNLMMKFDEKWNIIFVSGREKEIWMEMAFEVSHGGEFFSNFIDSFPHNFFNAFDNERQFPKTIQKPNDDD